MKKFTEEDLRDCKVQENGTIVITCCRHYYGEKNKATWPQRQFFSDLGGTIVGCTSHSQWDKCVTKRDVGYAIEQLKDGKDVIIKI
jgi:hypothetical protein